MKKKRLKIWESAALVALCLALCAGTWASKRQESLSRDIVRLHVLAHSDESKEQQIKLQVRDAVLRYMEPRLRGAESSTQAQLIIRENMTGIARVAASAAQGRAVQVSLSREHYPSRQYENFALPAGEYRSLRVVLGDGAGENWWCVVFPPLCTEAVSVDCPLPVLSSADISLMNRDGGYRLGFRSIELWDLLMEKLKTYD